MSMIGLSMRFLVLVVASSFLSPSAFAAKGVARVIQTGSTQIETFVFGDGPVSLVIAAGNDRPASQDHPERVLGVILIGAGGEVAPSKETIELYKRYLDQGEFPALAAAQAKSSDATPKEQWATGGTAPMLVLTCLLDRVAVPESALVIAKNRPETWLVGMPGCGHNMLNERGDDLQRLIVEFINRTQSGATR